MGFLDEDAANRQRGMPWQAWALLLLASLWMVIEAEGVIFLLSGPLAGAEPWLAFVQRAIPPAMLALIGWALLGQKTAHQHGSAGQEEALAEAIALREVAVETGTLLETAAQNAWQMRSDMAEQAVEMQNATQALTLAGQATASAAAEIGAKVAATEERLPHILATSQAAIAAMTDAAITMEQQLTAQDAMLTAIREQEASLAEQGRSAAERMAATLQEIEETSGRTTQLVANRAYALDGAVTGTLDRSVQVLDVIRESLLSHQQSIELAVKSGQVLLESWGQESVEAIEKKLSELSSRAHDLDDVLVRQVKNSSSAALELTELIAASEERLSHFRIQSIEELQVVEKNISSIDNISSITLERMVDAQRVAAELAERLSIVGPEMHGIDKALATQLPEVGNAIENLDLVTARVHARVADMQATVASCTEMLAQLTAARKAEEARFDALIARFTAASVR